MRRRVLVAGGAGFIGAHLCRRLLKEGCDVLCVDNFYTGTKEHIAELMPDPYFELVRADITFPLYLEVDEIYNLACPASPVHYQRDPVQTTKTSVHGSINLLGLAKRVGASILLASTSEVYGDPQIHPQPESYWGHVNPIGPRACYDVGKRCAETLFVSYHEQYDLNVHIARIFNTYGPHMRPDDGRVVSNFIVQALRGEPLTIYGSGEQSRSFCYVDDLIEGLSRLQASDYALPVNLGNPHEITVLELAETIQHLIGGQAQITFHDLPQDDPVRRRPQIDRAQEVLDGWCPTVSLKEGLTKTIDYFDALLTGPP